VNEAFRELEAAGELTVRIYEQANFTRVDALREFIEKGNVTGSGTEFFRIGPLKMLGDGALGARTAFLSNPYADDPTTRGIHVFSQQEFDDLICCANASGMQCAIHCIGDACLDMVLSSLEKALTEHPRKDHRHGIVHCQITRTDQLQKIADLGLHVYAQSIFLDYDIHMVKDRVGEELANSSYSWKTLKNLGATISNGSDCPVELPNVLAGIQCAVTRNDLKGSVPAYLPEEAFTIQEALDSFTSGSAYASFTEHDKGKIQPGMLADFVVLNQNPFAEIPSELRNIAVLETYVGGWSVYKKS
jgi:predicted amidohydrolase YtcJ